MHHVRKRILQNIKLFKNCPVQVLSICSLSRKRYEIGPLDMGGGLGDRSVSVPMTLSDPERRDARGHISKADLLHNAGTV